MSLRINKLFYLKALCILKITVEVCGSVKYYSACFFAVLEYWLLPNYLLGIFWASFLHRFNFEWPFSHQFQDWGYLPLVLLLFFLFLFLFLIYSKWNVNIIVEVFYFGRLWFCFHIFHLACFLSHWSLPIFLDIRSTIKRLFPFP